MNIIPATGFRLFSLKVFGSCRAAALQRIASLASRVGRRRPKNHYRLCIFKPDGIGDFVLALGTIRLLLKEFGAENCVILCWPSVRALAEMEFHRTHLIIVPECYITLRPGVVWKAMRLRLSLAHYQFDQLVCLRHRRSRFQNLAMRWIRTNRRAGLVNQREHYIGDSSDFIFDRKDEYPLVAESGWCLELEAHRRVGAQVLGRRLEVREIAPEFTLLKWMPGNYVLVSPFSSAVLKDYPSHLMVTALSEIQRKLGLRFQLSFSPQDRARAIDLHGLLQREGIHADLPLATSFREYVQVVAGARAVLSVDTATAHIAVALGMPTVVILGGGHYGQFGPWGIADRHIWVTNHLKCFNCGWRCQEAEPYCITRVTPHRIVQAMEHALAASP